MHWFIPYLDTPTFDRALREMVRLAQPDDCVTVMAPVIVPGDLPVDVDAGVIWKPVCRAERHLFHARETAARLLSPAVTVSFVRVQARTGSGAMLTGAAHCRADCLLIARPDGVRGALSARFGTIAAVRRSASCGVRVIRSAADEPPRDGNIPRAAIREIAHAFAMLRTIATNPTRVPSASADRERGTYRPEEHHAC